MVNVVMAVPLSAVPRLRITIRQKLALAAIFGLSFFLIAVEIVRYLVIVSAVTNIPHILIWNYVSACASIVLVNLPILRPLVFKSGYMSANSSREASTPQKNGMAPRPMRALKLQGDEGDYPLKYMSGSNIVEKAQM
jgi:hypothetical protein